VRLRAERKAGQAVIGELRKGTGDIPGGSSDQPDIAVRPDHDTAAIDRRTACASLTSKTVVADEERARSGTAAVICHLGFAAR